VSLALWGHVHKYERTCALQNRTCMENLIHGEGGVYPVHLVIGMGGQDWQPIDQPRPDRPLAPIFPQPAWSLFRSFEFGYIRLHANRSLMTVSYVGNHDGEVHDVVQFSSDPIVEIAHQSAQRLGDLTASHSDHQAPAAAMFTGFSGICSHIYGSVFPLAIAFVLGAVVTSEVELTK
jgi:hypothetical protein